MARHLTLTLLTLVSLAPACAEQEEEKPDPLIGRWESADNIAGEHNELSIDATMRGEATLYFYLGSDPYQADFDVTVRASEPGVRYELEMECEGNCGELDFDMECDLHSDLEMECEGDGGWSEYVFEWEKR